MVQTATFAGNTGQYLSVPLPSGMGTFPYWVSFQSMAGNKMLRNGTNIDPSVPGAPFVPMKWIRTSGTGSVTLNLNYNTIQIVSADGSTVTDTASEALMHNPFWDTVIVEFISSTSRKITMGDVVTWSFSASVTPDFSAGSPEFRIGGNWYGQIANVACGSGSLSAGDRTTLTTFGANYSGVTGITHWWTLDNSLADSVGSATLTNNGAVTFATGAPNTPSALSKSQLRTQVFKAKGYPAGTCSVASNVGSPTGIDTTGWTNLVRVDRYDGSYDGMDTTVDNPLLFGIHKYVTNIPVSPSHAVIVNGGHEASTEAVNFRTNILIKALIDAGYDVFLTWFYGYDPTYAVSGSETSMYYRLSSTVNPLEKMFAPTAILLNTISGQYSKISAAGLSGGPSYVGYAACMDSRINHAICGQHGLMAWRREGSNKTFIGYTEALAGIEENMYTLFAKQNRIFRDCHGRDDAIEGETYGISQGGYRDSTAYTALYLTPAGNANPAAQVAFYLDQGGGVTNHYYSDYFINTVLIGALTTSLNPIPPSHPQSTGMVAGINTLMNR